MIVGHTGIRNAGKQPGQTPISETRQESGLRNPELYRFLQSLSPTDRLFYEPPRSELEWSILTHLASSASQLPVKEKPQTPFNDSQAPQKTLWEKPIAGEDSTWVLFCGRPDSGKTKELAYFEQAARQRWKPTVVALSARSLLKAESCASLSSRSNTEEVLRCVVHQLVSQLRNLDQLHLLRQLEDYHRLLKGDWSENIWWRVLASVLRHGSSDGLALFFDDLDEWLDSCTPAALPISQLRQLTFFVELKNLLASQDYGHVFFFSSVKSIEELGFEHFVQGPTSSTVESTRTTGTTVSSEKGLALNPGTEHQAIKSSNTPSAPMYYKRSVRTVISPNDSFERAASGPVPSLLFVSTFRIGERIPKLTPGAGSGQPMGDGGEGVRRLLLYSNRFEDFYLCDSQRVASLKTTQPFGDDIFLKRQKEWYLHTILQLATVPERENILNTEPYYQIIVSWVLLARQPLTSEQLQFASAITARTLTSGSNSKAADSETVEKLSSFVPFAMSNVSFFLINRLSSLLRFERAGSGTLNDSKPDEFSNHRDSERRLNVCFRDRLVPECLTELHRRRRNSHNYVPKDTKGYHGFKLYNHTTLASVCLRVIRYYRMAFEGSSTALKNRVTKSKNVPPSAAVDLELSFNPELPESGSYIQGLNFRPPPSHIDKSKEATLDSIQHFFQYAINNWHYHYSMSKLDNQQLNNETNATTPSGLQDEAPLRLVRDQVISCLNDQSWRKCWYRHRQDHYHRTTAAERTMDNSESDLTALEVASELGLTDIVRLLLLEPLTEHAPAKKSESLEVALELSSKSESNTAEPQNDSIITPKAFCRALVKACRNTHEDVIHLLLQHGYPEIREQHAILEAIDPESDALTGQALALLAEHNLTNAVTQFLNTVTHKEDERLKATLQAARSGSFEAFKTIREHDAGIEWEVLLKYRPSGSGDESLDGRSVCHCAAIGGSLPIVEYILRHLEPASQLTVGAGHGFNGVVDKKGRTPLMVAAHLGHHEVVQALLGVSSTDPTSKRDYRGNTALHYAASRGSSVAVFHSLLLQSKSWDQRIELSVLKTAFLHDQVTIVDLLLQIHPSPSTFESVAQLAAKFGWLETLKNCLKLIESSTCTSTTREDGKLKREIFPFKLLEQACLLGQTKTVEFLLQSISKTDSRTWASLLTASKPRASPITPSAGNVTASPTLANTSISKPATESLRLSEVSETSEALAAINPPTGASPPTATCAPRSPQSSEKKSDIATGDITPSHYYAQRLTEATAAGSLSLVRLLVDAVPMAQVLTDSIHLEGTLLATATFNGHYLLVLYYLAVLKFSPGSSSDLYLENSNPPFKPWKPDVPKWNPPALFVALAYRKPEIFELLFNNSDDEEILIVDYGACCLLHHAALLGDTVAIRRILEHPVGATQVNYVDHAHHMPLRYGLWDLATTKLLLPQGFDGQLELQCICVLLPFRHAVEDSNDVPDIAALLLDEDIRICRAQSAASAGGDLCSADSSTSEVITTRIEPSWLRGIMTRATLGVYTAIENDFPTIVSMIFDKVPQLLALEAKMQQLSATVSAGRLPFLETASTTRKPKVLAYLLARLREKNVEGAANRICPRKNSLKQSLLFRAVAEGWEDIVSILVSNGADVNSGSNIEAQKYYITPLYKSVVRGFHKVARILLENGARAGDYCIQSQFNAAHVICHSNNEEAINAFLEFPDELFPKNLKTSYGGNILMEACQSAKPFGVSIFLRHKSGIGKIQAHERDKYGRNALDITLSAFLDKHRAPSFRLRLFQTLQVLFQYKDYRFSASAVSPYRNLSPLKRVESVEWVKPQPADDPTVSKVIELLRKRVQEEEQEDQEEKRKQEQDERKEQEAKQHEDGEHKVPKD